MMAGGESSSEDGRRDDNAEQEEPQEPLLKKQNVEQKVGVASAAAAAPGASFNGVGALLVKRLAPEAVLPGRESEHAAGYDLCSAYEAIVPARGKALVKTELSIAIPEGTYGRIAPRSGLAWKHSIDVGAGVIDYDYRGPIAVILFNHSDTDFNISEGDRIAQLILEKISTPEVVEVDSLESTERGADGFGSSGIRKKAGSLAASVGEAVSTMDTLD